MIKFIRKYPMIFFTILAIIVFFIYLVIDKQIDDALYTESVEVEEANILDKYSKEESTYNIFTFSLPTTYYVLDIGYSAKAHEAINVSKDVFEKVNIGDKILVKVYYKYKNEPWQLVKCSSAFYKLALNKEDL